jgi:hypothetical protein
MSTNKKNVFLEKINIENLFISKDGTIPYTNGKIDIETLFKKKNNNNNNFEFDSRVLLDNILKKRTKMKECHAEIFKACCERICMANTSGITDIIYNIPHYVPECTGYNTKDCVQMLKID